MPEALKTRFFTTESIQKFADEIIKEYKNFNEEDFLNLVYSKDWKSKELKEKMYHVTKCLHDTLPENYLSSLEILLKISPYITGFEAMVLPDFVEQYGTDYCDESLSALKEFTKYASSEFAIRPFIIANAEKSMKFMLKIADDKHHNVRRFSSEGCRPRLPWAMALPNLKKDPSLIFPILEKLKNDESEFVRRSVANNLNDISKDHPDLVIEYCEKWYGKSKNTDWVIKHACRTLLKSGNKNAMLLFGFGDPENIEIKELNTDKRELSIGSDLQFSFKLINNSASDVKIRLEYNVGFMKANGKQAPKIFQLSEKIYKPGEFQIKKKHSFKNLSTRKHYPGEHSIEIVVNGIAKYKIEIELKS